MNDVALLVWALVVVPLGVTRAMQIFLWDRITERPRQFLLNRWNPEGFEMGDKRRSYRSYVLECPWCSSVWIGLLVAVGLRFGFTRIFTLLVLSALAASLVAVLLDRWIDASRISDEAIAHRESLARAKQAQAEAFPAPPPVPPGVDVAFDQAVAQPPGS